MERLSLIDHLQVSFRSVVVITLASHARGPGFETQRKHIFEVVAGQFGKNGIVTCSAWSAVKQDSLPSVISTVEVQFRLEKE